MKKIISIFKLIAKVILYILNTFPLSINTRKNRLHKKMTFMELYVEKKELAWYGKIAI